jgi:adenylyltransferase/sulfurtransferase
MLTDAQLERYARQIILPCFGEESQRALMHRHVAVIGAGGLGAPVIQYLAAAGIGRISVIDDDVIDASNLNRQVIYSTPAIGTAKAEQAAIVVQAINPEIGVTASTARFTSENAEHLITDADVIADCSDTGLTRHEANTTAHRLRRILVFGGAVRLEGQVSSFASGTDPSSPCFSCVFPESAEHNLAPRCSEAGILGPVTGVVGTLMAHEILRQCLLPDKPIGEPLTGKLILYDAVTTTFMTIATKKRANCPVCGG